MYIESENINKEIAQEDLKQYSEYVKKEHEIKVDFNKLEDKVYYIKFSPKKIIPVGFYNKEDAQKIINRFSHVKRITEKRKQEIEQFMDMEKIETIDYLTANDLFYHSKGNWIK